ESEERFRAMADGTPLMIWVTDPEGRMRFVNRAYCEFFGTTLEAVQRGGWQPLLHPEDEPRYVEAFFAALQARKSFRAQGRVRRHDGAWRWVESSGEPRFSAAGQFLGMAGSSPDVTERVAFQAELERQVAERTAQLAEANANLQHFAQTAAHDLRAPLRGIVSFAQVVMARFGEPLGPIGRSLMERLVESAEQMGRLLNDLLDYSRVRGGELRPEKVPLDQAVREALGLLEKEIQARQAEVRVATGLPEVMGHPATVVTVVSNLVSNGLKFVPAGTRPRVRVWAETRPPQTLTPQPSPLSSSVRLWVEDNGIGIAPEDQRRVFASFERVHDKEAYPGTGLGLAIVRQGVERMGGRVGVESEPGRGSRFWVELKAAEPPG
ncbi:MAG TPA: PAS domain-containing sensor histidine kinase, partial [Bacillota bacterium]|nr:PAS domain-containing sensor histidine kinase [Bacillota bacterium]